MKKLEIGPMLIIYSKIEDIQRRLFGHVERVSDKRLRKRVMYSGENAGKSRGRSRKKVIKYKDNNTRKYLRELPTMSREKKQRTN